MSLSAPLKPMALLDQSLGRDMTFKILVYSSRLLAYMSDPSSDRHNIAMNFALKIHDCRALINTLRFTSSFVELYHCCVAMLHADTVVPAATALQALCALTRIPEQFAGEINYYARYGVIKVADRTLYAWSYRFWKSWSLFFGVLADMCKLLDLRKRAQTDPAMTPNDVEARRTPILSSLISQLFEMVIYFQWYAKYRPNQGVANFCGLMAGLLGARFVMTKK
eukprot:PhM_4_TR5372/c0_g1_i1/m.90669